VGLTHKDDAELFNGVWPEDMDKYRVDIMWLILSPREASSKDMVRVVLLETWEFLTGESRKKPVVKPSWQATLISTAKQRICLV